MSRLIDADALVWVLKHSKTYHKVIALDVVLDAVRCSPTIDAVEVVRGEWIYGEHEVAMCDGYRCDKCGYFVPWGYEHKSIDFINDYHFCPNCGARMKGADDE